LVAGREAFIPFTEKPKVKTVAAWDGKDH